MIPWGVLAALIAGGLSMAAAVVLLVLATPWGIILRAELREYLTRRAREVFNLEDPDADR